MEQVDAQFGEIRRRRAARWWFLVRIGAARSDTTLRTTARQAHSGSGRRWTRDLALSAGGLYRNGYARVRRVRTRAWQRQLRPQRVACRRCGHNNMLLLSWCVPGRSDDAETIGVALLAAAQGQGHRPIAARLGRAESTVCGWLRAFHSQADPLRHRGDRCGSATFYTDDEQDEPPEAALPGTERLTVELLGRAGESVHRSRISAGAAGQRATAELVAMIESEPRLGHPVSGPGAACTGSAMLA
jgi:Homeodomain-like domain